MGLFSHEAPLYEVSDLTEHRHEARANAVRNAKEKAEVMIDALGDPRLTLGFPITVNDIPLDVQDDASSGFYVKPWYMHHRGALAKKANVTSLAGDSSSSSTPMEPSAISKLLEDGFDELFDISPIRVSACVRVIFEVCSTEVSDHNVLSVPPSKGI